MSYSIIRISKVKNQVNTAGIQKHVQRENKNYNNKDIDHEKTVENYDLIHDYNQNYKELIDGRIAEGYKGERKIRNDAIKHVDGVITSDHDFFKKMCSYKIRAFFQDSKSFLEKEYGEKNLIYATVHLDEATPHMHFGVVPITKDGRLSAKEVIGNREALTRFQNRFNVFLKEKGYELERGKSRLITGSEHQKVQQFKGVTEYHKNVALKAERDALKQEKRVEQLTEVLQKRELTFSHFEKQTKVVQKLFGNSEIIEKETGNVVLSKEQFRDLTEKVSATNGVMKHYKQLKSTDLYKENQQLRRAYNELTEKINSIDSEHEKIKKENVKLKKQVSDLKKNISVLYQHTKIIFKDQFKTFREKIQGDLSDKGIDNYLKREHIKNLNEERSKNQDLER